MAKKASILFFLILCYSSAFSWGFFAHRVINRYAVYLLPPQMLVMYKPNIPYLWEHAVSPDKRRYIVPEEGPRHYIDIDHYGAYPFLELPREWEAAEAKFTADSLQAYGIAPWWIQTMLQRLTYAFKTGDKEKILKYSAEIGHYIADAHVPLHASGNHNGQKTNQHGIHGFWESRIPELLADKYWDFFIGKAEYLADPLSFIWDRVLESAIAADTVLLVEKALTIEFPKDKKYAFEERNGVIIRQYSTAFSIAYNNALNNMVERRMRQSVYAIACFWYTAWVNAGQPSLTEFTTGFYTSEELQELNNLHKNWRNTVGPIEICE